MEYSRIIASLERPAQALGILPELAAVRPRFSIHLFKSLPSTNQRAWELIAQGAGAGTVVVAERQSAGKGQWGRQWASAPGGLYVSLVLETACGTAEATLLTLASAWGVVAALENLGICLQLKWPNDLVSQGKKLGGILAEMRSRPTKALISPSGGDRRLVVIGVGLNWNNSLPDKACSLKTLLPDSPPDALNTLEDLCAVVLRGILQGHQYWHRQGTPHFLAVYQRKLANLGQTVTVQGHRAKVLGVSPTGDLLVRRCQGEKPGVQILRPGEIRLGYNY